MNIKEFTNKCFESRKIQYRHDSKWEPIEVIIKSPFENRFKLGTPSHLQYYYDNRYRKIVVG